MRLEKNASITAYSYDEGKNYVTSITDPLDNTIFYDYDDLGNLTSYTDAKGNSTTYNYDLRNLLTEVVDPNSNQTLYDYDSAGNLVTVTDAKNNQSSYSYNEFNLLSSITNPLSQTISFEYDDVGNRTETTYPTGNQLSYAYNQLNRLIEVYYDGLKRWDFAYDRNGNLTTVSDLATTDTLTYNSLNQLIGIYYYYGYRAEFTYDERGNVSSALCNNGSYTTFDYDAANRLQLVRNYSGNGEFFAPVGELLEEFEYNYDANGNRTSVTTTQGSVSYQYDDLNRLVEETLLDGTVINYSYDSVGNRTEKSVTQDNSTTTTNYSYNDANELITVDNQEYIYDENGNLINNGEYLFSYNANNRLIEVTDSTGATIATYTYDYQGLRKSKTTAEGTINYYYDLQGRLIYETNQSGTMIADYTYDAQNNPVTMTRSGITYYYHLNGHGDVIALSDENGQVVAEYDYDAWGNILSQSGSMAEINPYRYAGYYYDEETGLYYLRTRYYDSEIGRFIRRDTMKKFDDEEFRRDPQSLNRYLYTQNNPVMYTDPSGLYSFWDDLIGGFWQAFGGAGQFVTGASISSSGYGAIIGIPLIAHGAGNFFGGIGKMLGQKDRWNLTKNIIYMGNDTVYVTVDTILTMMTLVTGYPDIFEEYIYSASILDELKPIPEAKWAYGQLYNDLKTLIGAGIDKLSD
ncbi:RHS repeat-associated protein [Orenia metallireducens]|uniref:RHS repeat-associated core domain-containing protein n=1 Tax=Orenia metallireducens TaxID=1413210 RepID=A0A285HSY7_9FIRM|nr:RHS repeat-associated core domain-containing protein [Orenia metallireducens]PRX24066.1 RHS repeat-associated protein [Orenia metallireducens]SNY38830.1 RHS repeat-associated core domain-containing protein [Orenia metallireducens]